MGKLVNSEHTSRGWTLESAVYQCQDEKTIVVKGKKTEKPVRVRQVVTWLEKNTDGKFTIFKSAGQQEAIFIFENSDDASKCKKKFG